MSEEVPPELRYTKDHEWVRAERRRDRRRHHRLRRRAARRHHARQPRREGRRHGGRRKAVRHHREREDAERSYAPVAGKVVRINADLASKPELVNEDCYGKAWMIAIVPDDAKAADALLDAAAYTEHVRAAAH